MKTPNPMPRRIDGAHVGIQTLRRDVRVDRGPFDQLNDERIHHGDAAWDNSLVDATFSSLAAGNGAVENRVVVRRRPGVGFGDSCPLGTFR